MKFSVSSKISCVLFGFVVGFMVIGGGQANADFTFGTPTNLGPVVNSGSREKCGLEKAVLSPAQKISPCRV